MARKQAPAALARQQASVMATGEALGGGLGLRERLLEMAGVTDAEQARLTRCAISKLSDLLSAKRTQRLVVNAGLNRSEVREFVDDDTTRQHAAAAELLDRFGVVVSKTSQNLNVGGNLIVNVSRREPPEVIQVVEAEWVRPAEVLPK